MVHNEVTSQWSDYVGEAFFISNKHKVAWYANGALTDVGSEVEHMIYCTT
jgi:hypothetical protein